MANIFKHQEASLEFDLNVIYKGRTFANIDTARWAAFFDYCGIEYIVCDYSYFESVGGICPAFKIYDVDSYHGHLKEINIFVETEFNKNFWGRETFRRIEMFANGSEHYGYVCSNGGLRTHEEKEEINGKEKNIVRYIFQNPSIIFFGFPPKDSYLDFMQDFNGMDYYSFNYIDGDTFECMPTGHKDDKGKGQLILSGNDYGDPKSDLNKKAYSYANMDSLFTPINIYCPDGEKLNKIAGMNTDEIIKCSIIDIKSSYMYIRSKERKARIISELREKLEQVDNDLTDTRKRLDKLSLKRDAIYKVLDVFVK